MPSRRVAKELNAGTYYVTLTVARWYYLFDRFDRRHILADLLRYCQEQKGLQLNGYVLMLNQLHLLVTSSDVAGFLRDLVEKGVLQSSIFSYCQTAIHSSAITDARKTFGNAE